MGRNTFETVCGFNINWPYKKLVLVLSNSMTGIPEKYRDHAELVQGTLKEVLRNYSCKRLSQAVFLRLSQERILRQPELVSGSNNSEYWTW